MKTIPIRLRFKLWHRCIQTRDLKTSSIMTLCVILIEVNERLTCWKRLEGKTSNTRKIYNYCLCHRQSIFSPTIIRYLGCNTCNGLPTEFNVESPNIKDLQVFVFFISCSVCFECRTVKWHKNGKSNSRLGFSVFDHSTCTGARWSVATTATSCSWKK